MARAAMTIHLSTGFMRAERAAGPTCSASSYERPKHVGIVAVIMPEGEFVDVERQVFFRNVMERPHDAALQERPELIEVRGVDVPADVLTLAVVHALVLPEHSPLHAVVDVA